MNRGSSTGNALGMTLERLRNFKMKVSNIGITAQNAMGDFLSPFELLEFASLSTEDEIRESQDINDFLLRLKIINGQEA